MRNVAVFLILDVFKSLVFFGMVHQSHLQQLNEAVQSERSEDVLRQQRCDSFLEKVILYQRGKGDIPPEAEFLQFRDDLIRVAAVKSLKSGNVKI